MDEEVLDPAATAPGGRLRSAVAAFNAAGEGACRRLRASTSASRVMYLLSELGDDGRVWILATFVEATRRRRSLGWTLPPLMWLGAESAFVNLGLKRVARRSRPATVHEHDFRLRVPSDTSFPSGHAASAALMAVILSEDSPAAPLWTALALGIGISRVHVGVHHPSDVAAGWAVGAALGVLARRSRRWFRESGAGSS